MFHVLKYFLEFKEPVFCKHFKDKSSHNNMIHVQITKKIYTKCIEFLRKLSTLLVIYINLEWNIHKPDLIYY